MQQSASRDASRRTAEDLDVSRLMDRSYVSDRVKGHPLLSQPSFKVASLLFGTADIRPTAAQDKSFDKWQHVGDPVADALVARVKAGGGSELRLQFEQALTEGVAAVENAPQELLDFFAVVENVPYWVDPARLERGSRTYQSIGTDIMRIFVLGLSLSYLAQDANEVLLRSGDLNAKAARRAAETLTWVGEVSSPGALLPGAAGYQAAVRVRLTHAFMRSGIGQRADWPESALPIHQATYVATPILFSLMTIAISMIHGHWMTRRDRQAILHLWRYVAYLVGVHPDLIAADVADQWRLVATQFNHQVRLDSRTRESGRALGHALIGAYPELFGLNPEIPRERRKLQQIEQQNVAIMHLVLGHEGATLLGYDGLRRGSYLRIASHFASNAARRIAAYSAPGGRRRFEDRQRRTLLETLVAADRRVQADLSYARTGD